MGCGLLGLPVALRLGVLRWEQQRSCTVEALSPDK